MASSIVSFLLYELGNLSEDYPSTSFMVFVVLSIWGVWKLSLAFKKVLKLFRRRSFEERGVQTLFHDGLCINFIRNRMRHCGIQTSGTKEELLERVNAVIETINERA